MAEPITIQKLIDASLDADSLEVLVNGDENTDVTARLGETYPSVKKAIKTLFENGGLPATPFKTKALMTASALVDGDYAMVTDGGDDNGLYVKTAGAWVKSDYDPLTLAKADATTKMELAKEQAVDEAVSISNDNTRNNYVAKIDSISNDILFAVLDKNGNYTDLQLDGNGNIHDRVIDEWRSRLGAAETTKSAILNLSHVLPVISSTDSDVKPTDSYYKDGELLPVLPDNNKAVLIGSSSAERFSNYLQTALKVLNPSITMASPAFGGSIVEQQNALMGNKPLKLKFANNKILAGDSPVTRYDSYAFKSDLINMTGWVDGVYGKLKLVGANVIFERLDGGSSVVTVADSVDFIPELGNQYRNAIQIIWIGKNNLTLNVPSDDCVGSLMENTNSIIDYNSSLIKRCIVMTHHVDTNTPAISDKRDRINRTNQLYKLRFKDAVFDANEILLGTQIFTDLSITRTAKDISQQALGNLPPSLSVDSMHLTYPVYEYVAQKLGQFIATKNWF